MIIASTYQRKPAEARPSSLHPRGVGSLRSARSPRRETSGASCRRFSSGRRPPQCCTVGGAHPGITDRVDYAACVQVGQEQSSQVHKEQESEQCSHEQVLWLQVEQVQSSHSHTAQESEQCSQEQVSHSS